MGTPVFSTGSTLGALLKRVLVDNLGDLCIRQVQAKKACQSTEFTERPPAQGLITGLGTEFRVPMVPPVAYPPDLVIQDVLDVVVNSLFQVKGTKLAVEKMLRVDLRDVVIPAHHHIPQVPVGDDVPLSASLEGFVRSLPTKVDEVAGRPIDGQTLEESSLSGCGLSGLRAKEKRNGTLGPR